MRPFITVGLIESCIAKAACSGAVTVARPLKETIKTVEDGIVTGRRTARGTGSFKRRRPSAPAYHRSPRTGRADGFLGTDDCVLVERLGHTVTVIEGGDTNIKITTPADFAAAGAILSFMEHGGNRC